MAYFSGARGVYALYLTTDYLPLLKLRGWPDFASVSLLKANFTGSALLFSFAWRMDKVLRGKTVDGSYENHAARPLSPVYALALLIVINSAIIYHFTVYGSPLYLLLGTRSHGQLALCRNPGGPCRAATRQIRDTAFPPSPVTG